MPADKPAVKWTPQQREAITTTGQSILVSAAAGSGKTAVLAERCAHLVCDAKPPCKVDQLLVVTFTEAAAAEMKQRIESALRERLSRSDDRRLMRQLALIEHAQVSTLHGFCARLLRQHFHLLGFDPNFVIIDRDEAALLRGEIARDLFAERYEDENSADFRRFIDLYGEGNDEPLVQSVIRTHALMESLVNPRKWSATARTRPQLVAGPLQDTPMGKELLQLIDAGLAGLHAQCRSALDAVKQLSGFDKYIAYLGNLLGIIQDWQTHIPGGNLDALAMVVQSWKPERLPSYPNTLPGKEVAHGLVDAVRKAMQDGPLASTLRFSAAEWSAGLAFVAPFTATFLDLVDEFRKRYDAAKKRANGLDFADLERFALKLLRNDDGETLTPSPVARTCHRQFEHVLVDEYQDINEVQSAILHLVSRECVAGEEAAGNLFTVGDVKQSIYRFRLAEPAGFMQRDADFRAAASSLGKVIDLQANFRSRAPLLDAINGLFRKLMTREAVDIEYNQSHHLKPGATFPPPGNDPCFTGAPIEFHLLCKAPLQTDEADGDESSTASTDDAPDELDRTEKEAAFIASRIDQLMGRDGAKPTHVTDRAPDGTQFSRPLRYRDIVILLRAPRIKSERIVDILQRRGIPVHSDMGAGYFDSMEVRDILSLLSLLDNQRQDIPLAAVLRSPLVSLPQPEDALARVRLAYPSSADQPVPFHEAVLRYANEKQDELAARLNDFLDELARWRDLARNRPLAELISTLYNETGYLAFCNGLENGEQRCANLTYLHERARQFGEFSRQGLYRFLQFLDNLQNETDLAKPSVLSEADDVVRLMSIHRSKGLEFPVVFLPDLGKRHNFADLHGPVLVDRAQFVGLRVVDEARRVRYPSLASLLVERRLLQQSLAEELRVLYVAMTRAKEHLILIGTSGPREAEKWQRLYANHPGPLPTEIILKSGRMLDWIGPAAASLASELPNAFALQTHPDEAAPKEYPGRSAFSDFQKRLAKLEPIAPPPPISPSAQSVIDRLTTPYRYREFTRVEATMPVGAWSKHGRLAPVGYDNETGITTEFADVLEGPRFLQESRELSAAEIGTATHVVLQHLDYTRPCTGDDLAKQIAELVEKRILPAAHASAVDRSTIEWFLASDVGHVVRTAGDRIFREVPFNYAARGSTFPMFPTAEDPFDAVMFRGRIDLLIPHGDSYALIDYKTDRVDAASAPARRDFYSGQVEIYRLAMEAILKKKISAVYLVFLRPGIIYTM